MRDWGRSVAGSSPPKLDWLENAVNTICSVFNRSREPSTAAPGFNFPDPAIARAERNALNAGLILCFLGATIVALATAFC